MMSIYRQENETSLMGTGNAQTKRNILTISSEIIDTYNDNRRLDRTEALHSFSILQSTLHSTFIQLSARLHLDASYHLPLTILENTLEKMYPLAKCVRITNFYKIYFEELTRNENYYRDISLY